MSPRPSASDRSSAGPRPEPKAFSAENARAQIMRIIWDRKSSETTIVGYWRYVPLIAVSLAALTGFAFFFLVSSLLGFVFGYLAIYSVCFAILAIINYKLVKAMNAHFRREAALRGHLIDVARHRSQSPSLATKEAISRMERADQDASKQEQPKNELVAAMSALPIVGVVFGFASLRSTTVAQAEHDRNWNEFLSQLQAAEAGSGRVLALGEGQGARKSNFIVYFAASLICFPFLAYWYREIERGTERHLRGQWQVEDQLAKDLL